MEMQQVKFYQTGTFTVGNRLLDEQRSAQLQAGRWDELLRGCPPAVVGSLDPEGTLDVTLATLASLTPPDVTQDVELTAWMNAPEAPAAKPGQPVGV